jgi:hypothetical protein
MSKKRKLMTKRRERRHMLRDTINFSNCGISTVGQRTGCLGTNTSNVVFIATKVACLCSTEI